MKKILSTVAMAIVAFTAVVSMSSCSNDDPSSFNAAPQVPQTSVQQTATDNSTVSTSTTVDYEYKAVISDDVMALYDVTITKTVGSKTTEYTFTTAADVKNAVTTGLDHFTAGKNELVSVDAKVTLKSNYKDILSKLAETAQVDPEGSKYITLTAVPNYDFAGHGTTISDFGQGGTDNKFQIETVDEELLTINAKFMSKALSIKNY